MRFALDPTDPNLPWILAVAGGALIGAAALLLLKSLGRILGVSGIIGGALDRSSRDRGWRFMFILGLIASGVAAARMGEVAEGVIRGWQSYAVLILAGLLVGYGSRLGNGCTSGHGVCGMGRLSGRSIVATLVFMTTAVLTVRLMRM